jgi:hypothetical protein
MELAGIILLNNPGLKAGEKRLQTHLYLGVLTPTIEKTNKIYQGLKPRKRFVSLQPRPEGRGY